VSLGKCFARGVLQPIVLRLVASLVEVDVLLGQEEFAVLLPRPHGLVVLVLVVLDEGGVLSLALRQ
jgi:hypothetical protein